MQTIPHHVKQAGLLLTCGLLLSSVRAEMPPRSLEVPGQPGARAPGLALDPVTDHIVLTWTEPNADGHALRFSVFDGQRFAKARTIASGHDWFVNWADTPGLHVTKRGRWLAHWRVRSGPATYAYDIRTASSRDRGRSWQPFGTPHDDGTRTEHGFVSSFDAIDGIGLVWLDGRHTGSGHDASHSSDSQGGGMTLRTATLTDSGELVAALELDNRVCDCCQTASAVTEEGPVVVFRDRSEREIRDIALVRGTADGWTEPGIVHADGWEIGGCPVNGPDVIARGRQVVVAWFTMADDIARVHLAVSEDAGRAFAEPLTLSPHTALGRVKLAPLDRGFVLAWMEKTETAAQLRLARFDGEARLVSERTFAELDAGRISGMPQVLARDDQLLIVWTSSRDRVTGLRALQIPANF